MTPSSVEVSNHAAELHGGAVVIDCHSDILLPVSDGHVRMGNRIDVPDSAQWKPPFEIPQSTPGDLGWPHSSHFGCIGQYSIPQFLAGGLTAQVCAIFVRDHELEGALRKSLEMVYWMHREVEECHVFDLITTVEDIRRIKRQGACGGIIALEGLEPLGTDLRLLDLFYKLGVRMAGLAHNRRNIFSDGTQHHIRTGGLTRIGAQAIARMNELGIVVDVGHLNQTGYWEALEATSEPVVLSHRSPKKFFPLEPEDSPFHPAYDVSRGRERLEALAENGGVFGVFFLGAEDVDEVVNDIEHVIDLVGPDHVGLGSDLYGLHRAPPGLEDISKVPAITENMVRRGHSDDVILKVLGGNFLRVFQHVWRS